MKTYTVKITYKTGDTFLYTITAEDETFALLWAMKADATKQVTQGIRPMLVVVKAEIVSPEEH